MAISSDGFIADANDNTPWTDDEALMFQNFLRTCDVVLLGRRTFELMTEQDEFVQGPEYMVVTDDPLLETDGLRKVSIASPLDMPEANVIGIIGGGELNGRLAEMGVIHEMILDIEPVTLGGGTKLFGDHEVPLKLKLLSSRQIGKATIQRHYAILKHV